MTMSVEQLKSRLPNRYFIGLHSVADSEQESKEKGVGLFYSLSASSALTYVCV